jgi:hypothetical protein
VASAITGASRPEQVHANAQASGVQLTPDMLAAVDQALGDAPVTIPTPAPFARPGASGHGFQVMSPLVEVKVVFMLHSWSTTLL